MTSENDRSPKSEEGPPDENSFGRNQMRSFVLFASVAIRQPCRLDGTMSAEAEELSNDSSGWNKLRFRLSRNSTVRS
jgi:hypothetical protein